MSAHDPSRQNSVMTCRSDRKRIFPAEGLGLRGDSLIEMFKVLFVSPIIARTTFAKLNASHLVDSKPHSRPTSQVSTVTILHAKSPCRPYRTAFAMGWNFDVSMTAHLWRRIETQRDTGINLSFHCLVSGLCPGLSLD
jgi:hypothetical protein